MMNNERGLELMLEGRVDYLGQKVKDLENQLSELKNEYYRLSDQKKSIFLYGCEVRGTQYIDFEKIILPRLKENDPLLLLREKNNTHDKHAIAVLTPNGIKLGYIPREHNRVFSRMIDSGNLLFARVKESNYDGHELNLIVKIFLQE